jgi:hypothetical protein
LEVPNLRLEDASRDVKQTLEIAILQYVDRLLGIARSGKKDKALRSRKKSGGMDWDAVSESVLKDGWIESMAHGPLQRVVRDLHAGFPLGAQETHPASHRSRSAPPPIALWTLCREPRPFALAAGRLRRFGIHVGAIGMPKAFSQGGLLAWAALAHEVCGHSVLVAGSAVSLELKAKMKNALDRKFKRGSAKHLPMYWCGRFHEAVADCAGILNMGPAMAVGFIGAYRAGRALLDEMDGIIGPGARLCSEDKDTLHPSDIFRGLLMASMIGNLDFRDREAWKKVLLEEVRKDLTPGGRLGKWRVSEESAFDAAEVISEVVVKAPLRSLDGRALGAIRNWRDEDEEKVARLQRALGEEIPKSGEAFPGSRAIHILSAGVIRISSPGNTAPIGVVFRRTHALIAALGASDEHARPDFRRREEEMESLAFS